MPLASLAPLALPAQLAGALLLDRVLGEPRRFHPLVGFGHLADAMERLWRAGAPGMPVGNRLRGLLAWMLIVVPFVALAAWLSHPVLDVLLLYLALGGQSLAGHGRRVAADLAAGDLAAARLHVGWMVSRDVSSLDEEGIARATTESVLENGLDAVFGALFWFCLFGGAGAVLFRLVNTLDAMWGYKDDRRLYFGWAAARLDDLLGFVPARLTALTYALLGDTRTALACWRVQAGAWASPNAGPVMAAGAGALRVQLGGAAMYHGRCEARPKLGAGDTAAAADIVRAVALVERGQWLWLGGVALGSLLIRGMAHG
ncbi:MAG: cobalamin biosynthesis protein [Betaproteobacteria bacterium HGW-Betaproteobacteria-11]|nr:MAG: cobalamin biosynthesis protein [Betaproteobacteria bacterium HGW-Betaproteobacteria-11]